MKKSICLVLTIFMVFLGISTIFALNSTEKGFNNVSNELEFDISDKIMEIYAPEEVAKGLQEEISVLIRLIEPEEVFLYYKSSDSKIFTKSKMNTEENIFFRYVIPNSYTQGDYVDYYIVVRKDNREIKSSIRRLNVQEKFYIHPYLEQFDNETITLLNEILEIEVINKEASSTINLLFVEGKYFDELYKKNFITIEENLNSILKDNTRTIEKEVGENLKEILQKLYEVASSSNIMSSIIVFEDISRFNYMYNGRSLNLPPNPQNPTRTSIWPNMTSPNNISRGEGTSPHRGIDFGMSYNQNVFPLYSGVVASVLLSGQNTSVVVRSNINGTDVFFRYTHIYPDVTRDQTVNSDTRIGRIRAFVNSNGQRADHLHISIQTSDGWGLELPHERFFRNISLQLNGHLRNAEHITRSTKTDYSIGRIVYEILPNSNVSANLYYRVGSNTTVRSIQGVKNGHEYTFQIPSSHSNNTIRYVIETNNGNRIATKPAKYCGTYTDLTSNRPLNNFDAYFYYTFFYPSQGTPLGDIGIL